MAFERFPTWVDGRLYEPGAGTVSTDDQGLLLGLAVFDGLLFEDGCRYFEEEHLARLARGAAALGIPWPPPHDPRAGLRSISEALAGRDAFLRLTLTRGVPGAGATLIIGARAIVRPPAEGVLVWLAPAVKGDAELENLKSTNRLRNVLAREEAARRGAWEALLPARDGSYVEGTISNLFVVRAGRVTTPPLESGVLPGIVRELVLAELDQAGRPAAVAPIARADLALADEIFLTNSTGRVIPVTGVLGIERERALGGVQGELTLSLQAAVRRRERDYRRKHCAHPGRL